MTPEDSIDLACPAVSPSLVSLEVLAFPAYNLFLLHQTTAITPGRISYKLPATMRAAAILCLRLLIGYKKGNASSGKFPKRQFLPGDAIALRQLMYWSGDVFSASRLDQLLANRSFWFFSVCEIIYISCFT